MIRQTDQTKRINDRVMELFNAGDVGTIVSYQDLETAGCDVRRSRSPVYRAKRRLLVGRGLNIAPVPKVGYQILACDEAPRLVEAQLRAAQKRLRGAVDTSELTDRGRMSADVRRRLDTQSIAIRGVQAGLAQVQRDQKRQEIILRETQQRVNQLEQARETSTADQEALIERLVQKHVQGLGRD